MGTPRAKLRIRFWAKAYQSRTAKPEPDGSFKLVLAASDPGTPNWLDTEGRPSETVFWRFQLPEEEIAPLVARVVKIADAKSA